MALLEPFTEPNGAVAPDPENLTGIYEALFYELFGMATQNWDMSTNNVTEFL